MRALSALFLVGQLSLLLSTAHADPDCGSVCVFNYGGFVASFKTKTNDAQTDQSGDKAFDGYACWYSNDLLSKGFKEGASCWVSVDVVYGNKNHESGANFNFRPGAQHCWYEVDGGFLNPGFGGVEECGFPINGPGGGRYDPGGKGRSCNPQA